MAICEQYGQAREKEGGGGGGGGGGGEVYSESEGSDYDSASESSVDSVLEETRSNLSNLSIGKRSKPRGIADDPEEMEMDLVEEVDERSFEKVLKNIQDGQLEKLKVEECKIFLRKYALRLTGNKSTLIQRIKEHQEILDGGGEKKYPISTFVLDCKGDACTGDVVMFKQNVYEMYNLASRSATGPPCGTRTVAGRIVKESYGAAKQQHTFTIEVLWSKGEKQLPPLYPLLIKGRNLYRFKTLRQIWEDEGERYKVLMEKHSRGSLARTDREARIQEKEKRKMLRKTRASKKEEPTKKQFQLNPIKKANCIIQETQQYKISVNLGNMAPIPQHSCLSVDSRKVAIQATKSDVYGEKRKPVTQDRNSGISSDAMKKAGGVQRLALLPQCLGSSIFAVSMESGPQQPIDMPKQSETHCLEMKSRHQQSMSQHCKSGLSSRTAQFAREHQQLATQPQQSDLLVDLSKLKNQPLQQSSFPLETRNVLLQTKVEAKRRESDKENRRFHNLEVKQKRSDYFGAGWPDHHSSYDQYTSACQNHIPPFKAIDYYSSKSSPKGQPLSTSHYHPMRPAQRPSYQQKQLCRHFAQGRCYYGDNCKFLHH